MTEHAPPPAADAIRPRRRARWPFILFTVFLIAMSLWWAKSAIIKAIALPIASNVTGCRVRCATATIASSGEIVLRDLVLRAPGVRGPAAEILAADELRIALDWSTFPPTMPRSMELHRPIIRLSQAEDLSLNIAPILRVSGSGSGPPPDVRIVDAVIELGEHRDNRFALMATLGVSGALTAENPDRSVYALVLTQTRAAGGTDADHTTILGTIDRNAGSLHIDVIGLDLADLNPQPGASSFRGYWEQLAIEGRIPDASVDYSSATGVAATFKLDHVAMKIPVPASPDPALALRPSDAPIELLAMRDVTGSVTFDAAGLHADIDGSIEDLRCQVDLSTDGLSLTAPLTCTLQIPGFTLTDEPRLKTFATPLARRIFRRFSGPTATLAGRVVIQRGHDTLQPERWSYRGAFELSDGAARYEHFPYPIVDIDATFHFDDTEFRIVRLSGVGPSGAKLLASGRIWPPGDAAAVEIDVTAVDLPMDEHFEQSMPGSYSEVFDLLFDADAYATLLDEGLVTPDGAGGTPAFALGGLAAMDIKIRRALGHDTHYTSDITLRLPKASFLPRPFQYPVVATDAVLHITDGVVTIPRMNLRGLTGAIGSLEGRVEYPMEPDEDYVPDVRLSVADVPVDPLLVHAIDKRTRTLEPRPDSTPDAGALVRALNVSGDVRCDAHILTRASGELGVDASVTLEQLDAAPHPSVALTDLSGVIDITESRVAAPRIDARLGDAALRIAIDAPLVAAADSATRLTVDAANLDIAVPIEFAAAPILPEAQMRDIKDARARFAPAGIVDATLDVATAQGAPWRWTIDLRRASDLALSLDLGRIGLATVSGEVRIDDRSASFSDFRAPASLDGESLGDLAASGTLARGDAGPTDLRLELTGARFEAQGVRRFVRDRAPGLAAILDEYNPAGTFSVALHRLRTPPAEPRTEWTMRIDRLALTRDGTPIPITSVAGSIAGSDADGRVGPMTAEGEGWRMTVDGEWRGGGGGGGSGGEGEGVVFDATLGVRVSEVTESFLASVPRPLDAVLRALEPRTDGSIELHDARLRIASSAPSAEPALEFTGDLHLDRVAISAGVPIERITGDADFAYRSAPGKAPALSLNIDAATAAVFGVQVTDARAEFRDDPRTGAILLRSIAGDVHGGRVLGRGAFRPARDSADATRFSYTLAAEVQQADFDAVLRDLRPSLNESAPAPIDRGRLDAALTVAGATRDGQRSLEGRLTARVEDGDVLNLPGVVPLLQLWNLQLPAGERIDLAFADAFLDDRGLVFDELGLYSPSLRITGDGSIRWSDQSVALTFESEGARTIPVLSELFRGVQGEIATARVTGRLSDPRLDYQSLSGARQIFGAIFGNPDRDRDGR